MSNKREYPRSQHSTKLVIFFILQLFCRTILADEASPKPEMLVGFFQLAPHAFINEQQEPAGAAIDYMTQDIAPKLGVKITWQMVPFSRLIHLLDTNKIDAALTLAKTPEREATYLYPETPITFMQSGIAVLANSHLTAVTKHADLHGTKIIFTKGGYLSPFMRDPSLDIRYIVGDSNIFRTMLRLIVAERADAVYNPTMLTLQYEAREIGVADGIRMIPLPDDPVGLYTVFPKNRKALFQQFNQLNTANHDHASYQELLKPYLQPKQN